MLVGNGTLGRLAGPVRGNGQSGRELGSAFRGAGWNVIKCLWSEDWDRLLEKDTSGKLVQLMNETVDGTYQACKAKGGAYVRKEFFGKYPELLKLVEHMSDEAIGNLRRGGPDPPNAYYAHNRPADPPAPPTALLPNTLTGHALGEPGDGRRRPQPRRTPTEAAM